MHIQQIDMTGSRLVGAITNELGMDGPKHHAIILGKGIYDSEIYIAEFMHYGYQVATFRNFQQRYAHNGEIRVEQNTGPHTDLQVAQRALAEIKGGKGSYDLIANNCESFASRAMLGTSTSNQVINTVLGVLIVTGLCYVIKNSK
ncbi:MULTISPECIES: lecithin retinol acyltransferase family protein [Deefgea]|uniref:LRAT domain-containing protein n=1 Tax=Deefgea chitinilytica TaxID=570276 RepID=A0ABS2CFR4_9NEIS|nr:MULTISPECIES: lecithin retinol acyltransferase family protein [Deefgea]MBM5572994.1 hypothetical protein [Deefgea chitinilytica]MBM9890230.1 lecithin retinol acyltransferase family protein [Deefgea sp. CFH1-16]